MDYEKKYKQLNTLISDLYPFMSEYCKEKVEGFFLELKESEDERMRRWIINYLDNKALNSGIIQEKTNIKNAIAWLEKQGEQKPAWSEEDETVLNNLIYALANDRIGNNRDEYIDWLKSLKDRVQPKQEWSEEDKTMLCYMEGHLEYLKNDKGYSSSEDQIMLKRQLDWLKSLRPQSTWRPSDEQMDALDDYIYAKYPNKEKHQEAILSLFNDLKKLKG